MVALLIAGLIAVIGAWLYFRSQNVAGSGAGGTPAPVPDQYINGGAGTLYRTVAGTATTQAIAGGATSYDANDPATAQRILDALARDQRSKDLAAAQGLTVDQVYQAHLAQDLAAGQAQTAAVMAVGGAAAQAQADAAAALQAQLDAGVNRQRGAAGLPPTPPTPPKSNNTWAGAVLNSGPPANTTVPPGYYWDYVQQKAVPLLV